MMEYKAAETLYQNDLIDVNTYNKINLTILRSHIKRLEEMKMKATSTEVFKDIIAIDFELQTFPNPDVEDKFIVSATNRDDIFAFVFEGPNLRDACRKTGLFTGWEKDQKIRELQEENEKLKQENENLKKHTTAKALEYIEINNKLQDENEELKYQLMDVQATKEVVEQKLNTREDILDQAKKCVCGQREQDYGTPESNFQLIADLWNDYLKKERLGRSKAVVDAVDVSMMMALMKIARIRNGGGSGDSFVDLAGYAACGGEIWHGQKVKDQN